ncbi:MAG TPA: filamentous hemagglutinin N-terminal domain-containing protein, partial [Alphaproteobacteria bacterium]
MNLNRALRLSLLIGTCLGTSMGIVWAGPEGGVVSQGSATIGQSGSNTTINQNTNRVLIDWQGFNVGEHESVNFIQPGASSVAVNRIHDANPSSILGSLSANGQVVLINPNGVTFGSNAHVDVNGLVVSTAAPTDSDATKFISGQSDKLNLSIAGNPHAKIINAGHITAKDAGLVGFVAPNVINSGIIIANKGTVQLASGDQATLDLYGDGLTEIAVSQAVQQQLIDQHGWVQADGGKVVITAAAGEHIVNNVINMGGVTQAHSIAQKDGKIILKGDKSTLNITGKIDASGYGAGQKGGSVTATAKHIHLKTGSLVDASGDKGGGTVKIGGDYQGKGALTNAETVTMESGATIHNDAVTYGDGGMSILWADKATYFHGDITGRGGAQGGNGGFVETSGKVNLLARGHVNMSAPNGVMGTWLLDPTDITIYNRSQGGTNNVDTVTTQYLEDQDANIILTADNNIVLDLTGDTLAPNANHSITLTATNGTISTASAGNMTTSGTGSIILNAGGGITLSHALGLTTAGGNITLNNNMTSTVSQSFNAGTGTITTKAVAMGANNLTLIGDDVVLDDTVHGTGILTLAPYTNIGKEMRISFYGGDYNLDSTEIGRLGSSWSMINIGTGSTQNSIKIADTSWANSVTFKTGGEVFFYSTNAGIGNASITTQASATQLLGTLTTQGGAINLAKLNSHSAVIDSNGGHITLDVLRLYADSNPDSLNVTSDNGDITMTGTEWLVDGAISSIAGKNVIFDAGTGSVTYGGTFDGGYNLSVTGST